MTWILYILLGLVAGIFSGFLGIGGGTILIPVLVYLFGLTQHQAQGTTLAIMVPPIGILAALRYYYSGNVKVSLAAFICVGFLFGALLGANFVHMVSDQMLKKIFGIFLVIVAAKMIFGK